MEQGDGVEWFFCIGSDGPVQRSCLTMALESHDRSDKRFLIPREEYRQSLPTIHLMVTDCPIERLAAPLQSISDIKDPAPAARTCCRNNRSS